MIAGLSKAITLYLAPVLSLTSLLLILFSYLAPSVMLSGRVALLTVTPSSILVQSNSSQELDGPSVFMGALGSCSRPSNDLGLNCTYPAVSPFYDLSVLPANSPDLLSSPPSTSTGFIAVSIAFSVMFLFLFTFSTHRAHLGRAGAMFERPVFQRFTAWIGFLGFFIGLTSFLVVYMWFGKAVQDFNDDIIKSGGPELIAATSNGFVMVWVGYAFYAVPVVASLAKLHITTSAGKA